VHQTLHAEREAFDLLLEDFVVRQEFWADRIVRFLFEVDLINRPYVYRNTPITSKRHNFEMLSVQPVRTGYLIDIPAEFSECLRSYLGLSDQPSGRFEVNHQRSQLPFMPRKSFHENVMYCQDMSNRMRHVLPEWRSVSSLSAVGASV
jgi:hypothetical protein